MTVREFIIKYPEDTFDMMTPGGFVFLTPEQTKSLLTGRIMFSICSWMIGRDRNSQSIEMR